MSDDQICLGQSVFPFKIKIRKPVGRRGVPQTMEIQRTREWDGSKDCFSLGPMLCTVGPFFKDMYPYTSTMEEVAASHAAKPESKFEEMQRLSSSSNLLSANASLPEADVRQKFPAVFPAPGGNKSPQASKKARSPVKAIKYDRAASKQRLSAFNAGAQLELVVRDIRTSLCMCGRVTLATIERDTVLPQSMGSWQNLYCCVLDGQIQFYKSKTSGEAVRVLDLKDATSIKICLAIAVEDDLLPRKVVQILTPRKVMLLSLPVLGMSSSGGDHADTGSLYGASFSREVI